MFIQQKTLNSNIKEVLLLVRCGSISVFITPVVAKMINRKLLDKLDEASITAWLIEEAICEVYLMQTNHNHELLRLQITNLEYTYSLLKNTLITCLAHSLKTQETVLSLLSSGTLRCSFNNDTVKLIINYEHHV